MWATTQNAVERSSVPGFIVLNLRTRQVHLAVSQIVAVVVEASSGDDAAKTTGQQVRIVISADAQEIHPEHARSFLVPAARMGSTDVISVIAEAKK